MGLFRGPPRRPRSRFAVSASSSRLLAGAPTTLPIRGRAKLLHDLRRWASGSQRLGHEPHSRTRVSEKRFVPVTKEVQTLFTIRGFEDPVLGTSQAGKIKSLFILQGAGRV